MGGRRVLKAICGSGRKRTHRVLGLTFMVTASKSGDSVPLVSKGCIHAPCRGLALRGVRRSRWFI